MPVVKNKNSEVSRQFWSHVERISEQVRSTEAQRIRDNSSNGKSDRSDDQHGAHSDSQRTGTDSR
jgi:hypothetical protein